MDYVFNFRSLTPYLGDLYTAVAITLAISLSSMVISLALGLVVALGRTSRSRIARCAGAAYVEFFRNTPLLIILYLVFFSVPELGLRLSPFQSALVGMSLHFGAYMAEILRSGLLAVPPGQYEAAQAQGMTVPQLLRHVVLPQVLRTIYAPLGNQFIVIVLGSSLCSAIAVNDIGSWMQTTGAASFRYFETFLVAGIVYAALCQALNLLRLRLGRMLFAARAS